MELTQSAPSPTPSANLDDAGRPDSGSILHALTVDVEEYFQSTIARRRITPAHWNRYPSRVEDNTLRLLDLLDRQGARATFFTVGWVARRAPRLPKEIVARGHELGCRGAGNAPVNTQTRDEFRADVLDAKRVLEDIAQAPVKGYRAPGFSIDTSTRWAFEVLAEAGFDYDASVLPLRANGRGVQRFPRFPVRMELPGERELIEVPPSTIDVRGFCLPGAGGGFLRFVPTEFALWALERTSTDDCHPTAVDVRPWEFDVESPTVSRSLFDRLRQSYGRRRMGRRLVRLLQRFRFGTVQRMLDAHPPACRWDADAMTWAGTERDADRALVASS